MGECFQTLVYLTQEESVVNNVIASNRQVISEYSHIRPLCGVTVYMEEGPASRVFRVQ